MPSKASARPPGLLPHRALLPILLLFLLSTRPHPARANVLDSIVSSVVGAVRSIVGGDGGGETADSAAAAAAAAGREQRLGPLVVKTAYALAYASASTAEAYAAAPSTEAFALSPTTEAAGAALPDGSGSGGGVLQLQLGSAATVTLHRRAPHSLVLAFQPKGAGSAGAAGPPAGYPAGTKTIPVLGHFVYTAEAPAELVDAFQEVVEGSGTQGSLADAVDETMCGAPLLHVLCTGQGPLAGGLALLCAPWAALQVPTANADAVTFAASWEGFNTQFSWFFVQLATLHYIWPFDSSHPAIAAALAAAAPGGSSTGGGGLAEALAPLITPDAVTQAIAVPNLPPELPPGYTPDVALTQLGSLAPDSAVFEPPPSDCPAILCKTGDAVAAACLVWDQGGAQSELPGLAAVRLHSDIGADAVVAWNASFLTGILLWQGTETVQDWLQDAIAYLSDAFQPGNLRDLFPDVRVHRGFLNQFASLTTSPESDANNITAVLLGLSGGQAPERLLIAGHSLGGALSELAGVWASTVWPNASVLVASSGAPRVGDSGWEAMFTAVVGRAYRYVNHLDEVPTLPPFDSYRQVPHGMWLWDGLVLLQDRPPLALDQMGWADHDCAELYVPPILNASAVTVPG